MWFNWFAKAPQKLINPKWGQFVGMHVIGEILKLQFDWISHFKWVVGYKGQKKKKKKKKEQEDLIIGACYNGYC
jgi:hypothetical protein